MNMGEPINRLLWFYVLNKPDAQLYKNITGDAACLP